MKFGTYNVFAASFSNQCTYWASERYHQLTGLWTPCTGNAYQWSGESATAGWNVNTQPPKGIASIICLQPFVQGAGAYGHVAVVEHVNSNGSVATSGYDWYPNEGNSIVTYVTFYPQNGVTFLSAQNPSALGSVVQSIKNVLPSTTTPGNASVALLLANFDNACEMKNPFDVNATTDTFSITLPGGYNVADVGSLVDPVSWITGFGNNLLSDTIAFILRTVFFVLGVYLLFRVIDHYLNITGMISQTVNTVGKVAAL